MDYTRVRAIKNIFQITSEDNFIGQTKLPPIIKTIIRKTHNKLVINELAHILTYIKFTS